MESFPLDEVFENELSTEELDEPGFLRKLADESVPFELFYYFVSKGLEFRSFSTPEVELLGFSTPEVALLGFSTPEEQEYFIGKIARSGDFYILKYLSKGLKEIEPYTLAKYFDYTSLYGRYFISGELIFGEDYDNIEMFHPSNQGIDPLDTVYKDRFRRGFYGRREWGKISESYKLAKFFHPSGPRTFVSISAYHSALRILSRSFTAENLKFFEENDVENTEIELSTLGIEISFPLAVIITKTISNLNSIPWIKDALENKSPSTATLFLKAYDPSPTELFSALISGWYDQTYANILFLWAMENFEDIRFLVLLNFTTIVQEVDLSILRAQRDEVYLDYKSNGINQLLTSLLYDRVSGYYLGFVPHTDEEIRSEVLQIADDETIGSIIPRMSNRYRDHIPSELTLFVRNPIHFEEQPVSEAESEAETEENSENEGLENKITNTDFSQAVNRVLPENIEEDPLTYEPFGEYYFKCSNSFPHYFDAENYIKFCRHSLENFGNISCSLCPIDKTFTIDQQIYRNSTGILPERVYEEPLHGIIYFSLFLVEIQKFANGEYLGIFLKKELNHDGRKFYKGNKIIFTVRKINQLFDISIKFPQQLQLLSEIISL